MESMQSGTDVRRGRVLSLDAMRGGAALIVVLYHATGLAPQTATEGWQRWLPTIVGSAVHFGYAGVYLFFVISGFCIHLFWARTRSAGISNPAVQFFPFWKRRVRRLYPAYLAALGLYLGYTAYSAPVKVTAFYFWDVISHLLMVHNIDVRTTYSINSAFWTLAIEEQLYLAYFLLLFLRTRLGWTRTLFVCMAVRILWLTIGRGISYFAGVDIPVSEAAATNWFPWALGALSVEAAWGVITLPRWCYNVWVAIAGLLCAMGLAQFLPSVDSLPLLHDTGWLFMHPAWGIGFFVFVNIAVRAEQRRQAKGNPANRALIWMAGLGLISYSLYLTHALVLMKWYWFGFTRFHILTISLLIMTPLSVFFSWVFYRAFERPFMRPPGAVRPSRNDRSVVHSSLPNQTAEAIGDPAGV